MGNCFVKGASFPSSSPPIYPHAQGLYSSSEPHASSSSLGFNGRTCSSSRVFSVACSCSVNYTQMGHHSVLMKNAIGEDGGSVKQQSFKLAHLLEKSFLEDGENDEPPLEVVTARISPVLLSKSSGESCGVGLEDPVHSKSESPRTKFVGLIVNQLLKSLSSVRSKSLRRSGTTNLDTFSSDMIFNAKAGDGISMEIDTFNSDMILNPKGGGGISKESTSLSSSLHHINIGRNCHFCSPGMCRPYSVAIESEKAFGSPLSIESNNLWERTRECSTFDEFSDSSSDLFDIDFLKPDFVGGVAFSVH